MTTRNLSLHSLMLAFILALGALVVWFFVMTSIVDYVTNTWLPRCQLYQSEELYVLCDGTPVIDSHQSDDDGAKIIRTLDGQRIKVPNDYPGSNGPREARSAGLETQIDPKTRFTRLDWNIRLIKFVAADRCPVVWYFVHDGQQEGHGYLVGYDAKTGLEIGYIGRNGASDEKPSQEEQFPVDGWRMSSHFGVFPTRGFNVDTEYLDYNARYLAAKEGGGELPLWTLWLLADDGLVQVNVKERTTKVLWRGADIISMTLAYKDATSALNPDPLSTQLEPRSPLVMLVRLPDRVHVFDLNGNKLLTYPLPVELRHVALDWLTLSDGTAFIRPGHDEAGRKNELFWINPKDETVRHEVVKLDKRDKESEPMVSMSIVLAGAPPGLVATYAAIEPCSIADCPRSTDYWDALGKAIATAGWPFAIMGAVSAVLSFLCFRRQRKFGLPWTWAWVAFVFLLGLPGYVGYLVHRKWPVRLPCPHCGRRVPRDRMACFACGSEFPSPVLKGIEVFA